MKGRGAARALVIAQALVSFLGTEAWSKKVSIQWSPMPGATRYEIEIQKEGESVSKNTSENADWSGDLPFGIYAYQVRAYDRIERPGDWTDPQPLVVMPAPPELTMPEGGEKRTLYHPGAGIVFKWMPVTGAFQYRFELTRKGGTTETHTQEGTELRLKALLPGEYSWIVTAIVKPQGRVPASFESKQWESKPSSPTEFKVEHSKLEAPSPSYPLGVLAPPSELRQRFKWGRVDGAELYELQVFPLGSLKTVAQATTADNSVTLPLPSAGNYSWKVRALANVANVDGKKSPEAVGPQSSADFKLDRNAAFAEGGGYVSLSTMLAPYQYRLISQETGINGNASSSAITGRLSGEYWMLAQVGVGAGFDLTNFQLNGQSYLRKGIELVGKYRFNLTAGKYGWAMAIKGGMESRDYFEILPSYASLDTFESTVYGAQLGLDLRKAFGDRFSVGIKAAYFTPLAISSKRKSTLADGASNRNVSLGAQLLYWLSPSWGFGAGAFMELRSISYNLTSPPSGRSSANEQVYMDGSFFFGSLIYSFGR